MSYLDINEVYRDYGLLVPDSFNGLLIIHLNKKINNNEIPEQFTQNDIKQALFEVAEILPPQPTPQVEKTIKSLLHFFIERPSGNSYQKYVLTHYSRRFIKLIQNKLHNPHRNFPLKDTFNNYLSFSSNQIKSIIDFDEWFTLKFNDTSRETIQHHIEGLHDEVNKSIDSLRLILQSKDKEALDMVREFLEIFTELGDKAKQLAEALDLKNEILIELKKTTDYFYAKMNDSIHYTNEVEKESFLILDKDWKRSISIYKEVKSFFTHIDGRLGLIRSNILFASSKLTELQENFKAQSLYKIRLRKLLEIVLKNSKYGKDELKLKPLFPIKSIPYERFKFLSIPFYDFSFFRKSTVEQIFLDEEYHNEEKRKIDLELKRQERTAIWVSELKEELSTLNKLDYEDHFFRILKEEGDIEIPIQVGFDLIQYASSVKGYTIDIIESIAEDITIKDLYIWRIKIMKENINMIS